MTGDDDAEPFWLPPLMACWSMANVPGPACTSAKSRRKYAVSSRDGFGGRIGLGRLSAIDKPECRLMLGTMGRGLEMFRGGVDRGDVIGDGVKARLLGMSDKSVASEEFSTWDADRRAAERGGGRSSLGAREVSESLGFQLFQPLSLERLCRLSFFAIPIDTLILRLSFAQASFSFFDSGSPLSFPVMASEKVICVGVRDMRPGSTSASCGGGGRGGIGFFSVVASAEDFTGIPVSRSSS